jgi:hypothetical protein
VLFVVIAASEERAGLTHSVLGRRRFEGQARMYLVQPPAPLSSTPRAAHISEFHVHPPRQKGHAFPPSLGPRACVLSGCVALRACGDSKKLGVFCGTNFLKIFGQASARATRKQILQRPKTPVFGKKGRNPRGGGGGGGVYSYSADTIEGLGCVLL